MTDGAEAASPPQWQARLLLRAARVATLATTTQGQPFASLVTPATAPDGSVLLLLSGLSEHTRHLRADQRCALLVVGEPTSANPQTTPRLTVTGLAESCEEAALKQRWLARHPYAALYADFSDFGLWRVTIGGALLVAGFGQAHRLRVASLLPDATAVAAIDAAAASILEHVNADHEKVITAIAHHHGGTAAASAEGAWRMVAVDCDGCDLAQDDQVLRVAWRRPIATPVEARAELVHLANRARMSGIPRSGAAT
jgi:putative heme iron utilization protein